MKIKKLLLDTNVVMDFALIRKPNYEYAKIILDEIIKGNVQGYITVSMVTDILYLLKKQMEKPLL